MPLNLCLRAQELQGAVEGTQLVVDTLHWAGPTSLLASCSLWLHGVQQVSLGPSGVTRLGSWRWCRACTAGRWAAGHGVAIQPALTGQDPPSAGRLDAWHAELGAAGRTPDKTALLQKAGGQGWALRRSHKAALKLGECGPCDAYSIEMKFGTWQLQHACPGLTPLGIT